MPLAHGATFIGDFSGLAPATEVPPFDGDPLAGYNNWSQSVANPTGESGGYLAWGLTVANSNGFGLGVPYAAPPTSAPFYVSHAVGMDLIATVGHPVTTLQTSFVVVDSLEYPDRNDYSIGFYGAGNSLLFGLDIMATSQVDVPGGPNDLWNIRWSSGNDSSDAFGAVIEDFPGSPALYNLNVTFTTINVTDVQFNLSISGSNTFTTSGILSGVNLAAASIAEYRVTASQGSGADWGDGFIGIAGLSVVPEPSAAILLGLSALGLTRRRRSA